MELRKCTICLLALPLREFYQRKTLFQQTGRLLYYRYCKECFQRRHYHENPKRSVLLNPVIREESRRRSLAYYHSLSAEQKLLYQERKKQQYANSKKLQDSGRIRTQRRKAKLRSALGSFNRDEWEALCNQYEGVCVSCGTDSNLTADHVIPLSKGGDNYISNIQPLCLPCNVRKGVKSTDYRAREAT